MEFEDLKRVDSILNNYPKKILLGNYDDKTTTSSAIIQSSKINRITQILSSSILSYSLPAEYVPLATL
ncbi:MAG: hypothetical protein IKE95_04075 [Methanobrevibacter sp.]|nr:hypothetical protein [Methanobrevibacter sp.]